MYYIYYARPWRFCARRTGAGGRGGRGLRLPPLSSHPQRCRMTSRVRHGRMFALAAASAAAQHHPAAGQCELQWPRSAGAPTLLGVISHGTTDRGGYRLLPQLAAPEVSCPGQPPAFAHPSALASPSQAPSSVYPLARPSRRCLRPLACSRWRTSKRQAAHRSVTGRRGLRAGPITASPSRRLHHVGASCSSASCSTDELMLVPTSIQWCCDVGP
jgi:hypothetical protein